MLYAFFFSTFSGSKVATLELRVCTSYPRHKEPFLWVTTTLLEGKVCANLYVHLSSAIVFSANYVRTIKRTNRGSQPNFVSRRPVGGAAPELLCVSVSSTFFFTPSLVFFWRFFFRFLVVKMQSFFSSFFSSAHGVRLPSFLIPSISSTTTIEQ